MPQTDLVLVNPRAINDQYPPISLISLAAFCREQGFAVEVIDSQAELLTDEETCDRVKRCEPLLVGLSFMTYQVGFIKALLPKLRATCPDSYFVAGGIHSSTLPEEVLGYGFDFVVVGEGEQTLNELLIGLSVAKEHLGDRLPNFYIGKIDGLWKKDGFKPRELVHDLDLLPMPAWDLVPCERYKVSQPESRYRLEAGECLALSTTRGCLFSCAFCCWMKVFGRTKRERSAVKVADEIEWLVTKTGISKFFFVDDGLLGDQERAEELAHEILRRELQVTFSAAARVTDKGVNPKTLSLLYEAGLRCVDFGVESGSVKILKDIHKGITLTQIIQAHEMAHDVGLRTTSLMMVGHLEEDWSDIWDSIALFADVETDYVNVNALTPYPATEVYEKAKENGWIRDDDWSHYLSDGFYRVMRNRAFTFEEINLLQCLVQGSIDVCINYNQHKPKGFLDNYWHLLRSTYPLGLTAKGRYLMLKYLKTRQRKFVEQLNFKTLKLKHTFKRLEDRDTAKLLVSVRKHPTKLLTEGNRLKRIRVFTPIVAEYVWDLLSDTAAAFYYTLKLRLRK